MHLCVLIESILQFLCFNSFPSCLTSFPSQHHVICFLNSPSPLSTTSICTGIGIPTRNWVVSWPTSLKKTDSLSSSSHHKPTDSRLGVGHFEPLLHPCWNFGRLVLAQVSDMSSQPVWVHVCSSLARSSKYCSIVNIHSFCPTAFWQFSINDIWALGRRLYQSGSCYSFLFSQSWPVKGLCITHHPLQKEAFLMGVERWTCGNRNKNLGNGLLLWSFGRIID